MARSGAECSAIIFRSRPSAKTVAVLSLPPLRKRHGPTMVSGAHPPGGDESLGVARLVLRQRPESEWYDALGAGPA